ncbi:uncharacterized protein LOC115707078 [Cannabis sativa]|uniref:Uncharacterized protein n=2 Tax=Cannabis sativa TaxID=3483 RepID=A0AB40E9I9_CANSA|nr:uncharacterized protein LOC115707078 [Cannabis sativa]KAF4371466.1 hypothetical protein F8388_001994 [Cannabis sativa]KAF4398637.1 hypothetical protein G4B88_013726 [Cannabis sativa]
MAEPSSSPPSPPTESLIRRYKLVWRVLLISNLALGAYIFASPRKRDASVVNKNKASEKAAKETKAEEVVTTEEEVKAEEEDPYSINWPTYDYDTATFPPPAMKPLMVREPIPEDQQRELFIWMLEEKRKLKPKDPVEKKRIDEDKAVLKQFIRAKTIPKL